MFKINLKPLKSTIRTIDQEMNQTRARYAKYLEETSRDFVAKRSNVEIRDPHTMAGNSYWELRDKIHPNKKGSAPDHLVRGRAFRVIIFLADCIIKLNT